MISPQTCGTVLNGLCSVLQHFEKDLTESFSLVEHTAAGMNEQASRIEAPVEEPMIETLSLLVEAIADDLHDAIK